MGHTPGPWIVKVHDDYTNVESKYYTICADVTNADAALISAAPDLLAALKALVQDDLHDSTNFCSAQKAIAKAEGR